VFNEVVANVFSLLLVPSQVCGSLFSKASPCWVEGSIRVCVALRGGGATLVSMELASMSFGCNA
jgi:hypothetical protein